MEDGLCANEEKITIFYVAECRRYEATRAHLPVALPYFSRFSPVNDDGCPCVPRLVTINPFNGNILSFTVTPFTRFNLVLREIGTD